MHTNISEREPVRSARARFTLMGFDQDAGVRQYAFQGITDGIRSNFTVGVDLTLIAGFGIQIQDLPLLCRELLERQLEGEESRRFILTDTEMRIYAANCAMARETAALKRKSARKVREESPQAAW